MDAHATVQLHTGRKMPVLGLGTWQLTHETVATVEQALKVGYRMIDTSGDYGTEPGVGEAIRKSGKDRLSLYVVTKVEPDEDAYQATKERLQDLGLAHVDLMLIHKPPKHGAGEKLWEGLLKAKKAGLTNDIGVSSYSMDLIQELIKATGEKPVVNQIEWSPFGHSQEVLKYCQDNQIIIQAFSPLTHAKRLKDETLKALAKKYGKSPAQLLIRWNLQLGTVPIVKANKPEHLKENLDAFDFEIDADDMATLNGLNEEYSHFDTPLPYI